MKSRLHSTILILLILAAASLATGQTVFRSVANGNWGIAGTWEKSTDNGSTWAAATAAPGSADSLADVIIKTGTTVIVEGSPKYAKNFTVETGGVIYANVKQPTSTIRYIRIKGSSVRIDGTFGYPVGTPDTTDALSIESQGDSTITFSGTGSINISRIRPRGGRSNATFIVDTDMRLTYAGGSGTGGSAFYSSESGSDNIVFTINTGRTLTGTLNANFATSSSTGTDGAANTVINVNGTLNLTGGILSLRAATGKTTTLNVGPLGLVRVGKDLLPTGTTGVTSTIDISGTMQVGTLFGRMSDFTNANQFVSGTGTYSVEPQSVIKVGAPTGLNATTGPIRTAIASFSNAAVYNFNATAAQVTGAQMPTTVKGITVDNIAGVTLTSNAMLDSSLSLVMGALTTGSNSLVLGPGATSTSNNGYVAGAIQKNGLAAPFTFHVGSGNTGRSPVLIEPIAGSGNVTVVTTYGMHPNIPNFLKALGRWWDITGTGITSANVKFVYPLADILGNASAFVIARYETGVWKGVPTTMAPTLDTAATTGINPFGIWSLADSSTVTSVENESPAMVSEYALYGNYPNPFNPSTRIRFSVAQSGPVQLAVYDVTGRLIRTLANGILDAGMHEVVFNAAGIASGVYVYELRAGTFVARKVMAAIK